MPRIISSELIASKIYVIRRLKVMLDRDLAQLYGVETRVLNQAVKRNAAVYFTSRLRLFPYIIIDALLPV